MKRIHVTTLATLSAVNSKSLPQLVNDYGRRRRWVGIGWVDEGQAQGDEPTVVNRNCNNYHERYGLCDGTHGHKGKHRCESSLVPRAKRYRPKARWSSDDGRQISGQHVLRLTVRQGHWHRGQS